MSRDIVTMLSIAGSDCSGGAGMQADIRAAAACRVFAATAVTAVTVQNSNGVEQIVNMTPQTVIAQIRAVFSDKTPDAIKIGMIGSIETGIAIAGFLKDYAAGIPVVVDPVMHATCGGDLCASQDRIAEFYMKTLFPLSSVITPNLREAATLLKTVGLTEESLLRPEETARILLMESRCSGVVLKGGHGDGAILADIFSHRNHNGDISISKSEASKIDCRNLHGTGCTYASIFASHLAKGLSPDVAFVLTGWAMKKFIADSSTYSFGNATYGPLNIFDYETKTLQK